MRKTLPAVFMLALIGCVTTDIYMLGPERPPVAAEDVQVYLPGDSLSESCERLAIIHGQGNAIGIDETDVINKLRAEAGEIGGNVIVLGTFGAAENIVGGDIAAKGSCVVYRCPPGN